MLVLDRSGSMSWQKITDAKTAAKGFIDRMDLPTDQVGLVSFSDNAVLNQTLTSSAGPVRAAIDALVADGATNIAEAITTAQAELTGGRHKSDNQPVLVLLSDGKPPAGSDPRTAASAAKAAGTRIFTIGLGIDVDPNLMRELASSPSDYFYAPDSSQLDAILPANCRRHRWVAGDEHHHRGSALAHAGTQLLHQLTHTRRQSRRANPDVEDSQVGAGDARLELPRQDDDYAWRVAD